MTFAKLNTARKIARLDRQLEAIRGTRLKDRNPWRAKSKVCPGLYTETIDAQSRLDEINSPNINLLRLRAIIAWPHNQKTVQQRAAARYKSLAALLQLPDPGQCVCGHGHGFTRCPNYGHVAAKCHLCKCEKFVPIKRRKS